MKHTAVIALLASVVAAALAHQAVRNPPAAVTASVPEGRLDAAIVSELLKKSNVPGVSIAVSRDFKPEWAR